VKLPWILKFLWAPLLDNTSRTHKQLRSWIVLSEIFYAVIILFISFFRLDAHFALIVMLMFVSVFASSTQDIATDIFAIRILRKEEKPYGNAVQSAGSFVGSLLGTGVLLFAYHLFGWSTLLWILAALVLLALIPLFSRKIQIEHHNYDRKKVSIKDVFSFFRGKRQKLRLWLLVFYFSGLAGILAMLKPYMVDLGYDIVQIGFASGILGTSTAAVASVLGAHIIKFSGRRISLILFAFINVLAGGFFWFIAGTTPSQGVLYAAICVLWAAYGFSMVAIFTSSMDEVRTHSEGTDFTVQIMITHISSMLVAVLSGKLADVAGYQALFGIQIVLSMISVPLLLYLYPVDFAKFRFKS
jgi:MFS family permease